MDSEALKYTIPFQLTKTIHREPYDAILPERNAAHGKIIVITGAGTGIGAATAEVWAQAGAEGVVLASRRVDKLEETATKVKALNNGRTKVLVVKTDLNVDGDVQNLFRETLSTFGRSPDVVLSNAGVVAAATIGEYPTDNFWNIMSTNLKGVYATAHHFINAQQDPTKPVGTFIVTNSGLAAALMPGISAYSISKLAAQRLVEYLDLEYPTLRSFTLFPGVVKTPIVSPHYQPYAHDKAELTGMLCLYLCSPRADYLRGGLASINLDIEEMEAQKDRIVKEGLLKLKYSTVLPASGGTGL